jgi:hypothetical protein
MLNIYTVVEERGIWKPKKDRNPLDGQVDGGSK